MFAETSVRILYVKKSFVYCLQAFIITKIFACVITHLFLQEVFLCGIIKRVKFYIIAVKGTTGSVQES